MIEKKRYEKELSKFEEEIRILKEEKNTIDSEIRILNKKKEELCNHKLDNGKTAYIERSFWIPIFTEGIDEWTGESETYDNGYTETERICTICSNIE